MDIKILKDRMDAVTGELMRRSDFESDTENNDNDDDDDDDWVTDDGEGSMGSDFNVDEDS